MELADGVTHWVSGAICGPLPGPLQTVPFAETFAFLMYLRHLGASAAIFLTDCLWVKLSFDKGPAGTTGAQHWYSETWRAIWAKIGDLGGRELVTVRKFKAHSTRRDLSNGSVDPTDKFGNDKADGYAKAGARMHPTDAAAEERIARTESATAMVGRFLAKMHAKANKAAIDTTPRAQRRQTKGVVRAPRLRKAKAGHCHTVVCDGKRARCTSCWRSGRSRASLDKRPCAPGLAHSLLLRGDVVQCWRCGCYSSGSAVNLLKRCRGAPRNRNTHGYRALARAWKGLCPKTGQATQAWLPLTSAFLNEKEARGLMTATKRLRNKTRW